MANDDTGGKLTATTWVPLGAAGGLAVTLLGLAWWLQGQFNHLETAQTAGFYEVRRSIADLQEGNKENVKRKDMEIWRLQLQLRNSTMQVPDLPKN